MTNTGETIQQLRSFRTDVIEQMQNREIASFSIKDIEIDNEQMSVGGDALSEEATKKVLSQLRVKNNFLSLSKEMNSTDWGIVKEKIKNVHGDQPVFGRKIKDVVTNKPIVSDIYMAAPKTAGLMEIDSIFNEVIDSIVSTGKDISIKNTLFLEDKDEIIVTLLEHDEPIDVFGNDTDVWKTGQQIVWNGLNFSVAPFFERLVCTNGNTAPQFGFKSNISNNKFNIEKIKKILEKEITYKSESIEKYLMDACEHMQHFNVSVKEFNYFREMFDEEKHPEILKKWFDDSKLNRAYGCIATEMPGLWQTTADSGKNAYDFFNDLTWIASHPDDAKLSERERVDLQIKASNLLFKKKLDLELIAPKPVWLN